MNNPNPPRAPELQAALDKVAHTSTDYEEILATEVYRLEEQVRTLRTAILWALGEGGTFAPQQEGQGKYWWRTELRRRAALAQPSETKEMK